MVQQRAGVLEAMAHAGGVGVHFVIAAPGQANPRQQPLDVEAARG